MKKILLALILAFTLLFLSACGTNAVLKPNTISDTPLNDKEKLLVSLAGSRQFVFDFNADKTYKWVSLWIDRYEHGVKMERTTEMALQLDSGKSGMLIAVAKEKEAGTSNWNMAISSGGGSCTGESVQSFQLGEGLSFGATTFTT